MPTAATGNKSGWSDINGAIRATKRSNGEYLIFAEENGYAKVMMYRWNPTPSATPINLIANSSFDTEAVNTQTPSGWSEAEYDASFSLITPASSSYTESYGGSNSGARHATHWKTAAYKVYTFQTKTGLASGLYTARVYAKRSGTQTSCWLEAKGYGSSNLRANIPTGSSYQLVEIKDINVTNGQCTIGVWSEANANDWAYFDDVSFFKQ